MAPFSATACIRFGWETFKKRGWFLIGATILFLAVVIVISLILEYAIAQGGVVGLIGLLARIALQMLAGMGFYSFALKAHDDIEHVTIGDLWRPRPFWKFTGTSILYVIIFVVGLILVIIPGIIWGIMFGYSSYLVLDKGMMPMDALKESKRITHGNKWELFLLGILSALIAIVGFICLGVGMFIAIPVVILANVHAFRTLQQRAGASA